MFKSLSIELKLTLVTSLAFLFAASISAYVFYQQDRQHYQQRLTDIGKVSVNQVELFRKLSMENNIGHGLDDSTKVALAENKFAYKLNAITKNDVKGFFRLVSLDPLNSKDNSPDSFEKAGLAAFEKGQENYTTITELKSEPYFRYLQALHVESKCLACHGGQEYKIGDIRGAISLIIPIKDIDAEFKALLVNDFISGFIVYLVLFVVLLVSIKRIVIRPLNKLSLLSEQIGSGRLVELDHHVSRDQVSHITDALIQADKRILKSNQELTQLAEAATHDSMIDPLTGLYNRRYLQKEAFKIYEESFRNGVSVCTLSLDIDHFKQINDTYGHATGDECIKHLCRCIQETIRNYDRLIRMGGEEFLLIMPNTNAEAGKHVAERIRQHYESTPLTTTQFGDILSTISIGFYYSVQTSLDQAIERSDQALYAAKNNGRNQVRHYD